MSDAVIYGFITLNGWIRERWACIFCIMDRVAWACRCSVKASSGGNVRLPVASVMTTWCWIFIKLIAREEIYGYFKSLGSYGPSA